MTKTSLSLIAVALATTMGATTIATTAYAAPSNNMSQHQRAHPGGKPDQQAHRGDSRKPQFGPRAGQRGGMQGGLLALVCNTDGTERLDNMLGRLSENLDLTDDQKVLFDDFSSAARSAQESYAASCETPAAPVAAADESTADDEAVAPVAPAFDPVEGMKLRVANMEAAATALETVIPSAEAFFDSLTEDQLSNLAPKRGR